MIIVFTTAPNVNEAENLAQKIVEAKLAACVQVLPPIKSFYFWDGEVRNETEYLLIIKTLSEKFTALEKFIKENHSYDVPEIISLHASDVSGEYSNWVKDYIS